MVTLYAVPPGTFPGKTNVPFAPTVRSVAPFLTFRPVPCSPVTVPPIVYVELLLLPPLLSWLYPLPSHAANVDKRRARKHTPDLCIVTVTTALGLKTAGGWFAAGGVPINARKIN